MEIAMKISRSEYLQLKRAVSTLTEENAKLKKELTALKNKETTQTTETKKKGAK